MAAGLLAACNAAAPPDKKPIVESPQPPKAAIKPFSVLSPHGARADNYYWLRDDKRKDPEMLAYLEAENKYKEAMLAPLAKLRETLYQEIIARIPATDRTVPYMKSGFWYYQRFEPDQDQPIHARKKGSLDAAEEVLIDGNARAAGQSFYRVGSTAVSPNTQVLAFTEDVVGRMQYSLRFRDLGAGKELPDRVDNIEPDIAWLADNRSVLYVEKDPQTLLSTRVRKHVIGTDSRQDALIYEEPDKAFYISLRNSKSDQIGRAHV